MPGPRTIDVYVNSENNYMQMARIFESKTVSSLLRFYGSKLDEAGRIDEDTIQDELNQIIRKEGIRTRPVMPGIVIATSAGHASSYLRKRLKARYIFHTATVIVEGDGIDKKLQCRLSSSEIQQCVRKTLEKVAEVDKKHRTSLAYRCRTAAGPSIRLLEHTTQSRVSSFQSLGRGMVVALPRRSCLP